MKNFLRIISFSKEFWRLYLIIAFFTILSGLLTQTIPFLVKEIIDFLVENAAASSVSVRTLLIFAGLILLVELSLSLLDNISQYFGDLLSVRVTRLLSQKYYDHLLSLSQVYFDTELTGTIINRLNRSVSEITSFLKQMTNNFVQWLFTAAVTLIVISFYAWPVALMLALLFPFYFWLTHLSSKAWKKDQQKINSDTDLAHGRFAEAIGQIRVVKSFIQEKTESKFFANQYEQVQNTTKKQSIRWHKFDILRRFFLGAVVAASIGIISLRALNGTITIGEFALLLQLIIMVRFPLFASSFIVDNLQRADANSQDYFKVLTIAPAIADNPGAKRLRVDRGAIEYKNVSFAYDDKNPVLKNISFNIKPDSKVALIGQSGEGKSTIANLLLRLYEPTVGSILIDGLNINAVTQVSLRQNIGVVFQDASLFSGTIQDNIAYSSSRVTKAEIEAAAKAAYAHKFIGKLPERYDTQIGERGVKLSGGQKQRIAIARALLKDPPILVLDEATSSLDSKAEIEVQKALKRLMKGRTTLIIAHRLSTIKDVDLIISLKDGKIAEIGTPGELAEKRGIYAELLRLQNPTATNKQKLKNFELVQ
jgi:ATP-binding cassette subfamily B protein